MRRADSIRKKGVECRGPVAELSLSRILPANALWNQIAKLLGGRAASGCAQVSFKFLMTPELQYPAWLDPLCIGDAVRPKWLFQSCVRL